MEYAFMEFKHSYKPIKCIVFKHTGDKNVRQWQRARANV